MLENQSPVKSRNVHITFSFVVVANNTAWEGVHEITCGCMALLSSQDKPRLKEASLRGSHFLKLKGVMGCPALPMVIKKDPNIQSGRSTDQEHLRHQTYAHSWHDTIPPQGGSISSHMGLCHNLVFCYVDDATKGRKHGGEELWPLPGKSPAMLRVHNIPKKVHIVCGIFPLYFERHSKATHLICFCSCETGESGGETLCNDINKSENLICC